MKIHKLRRIRLERCLTQQALARLALVTPSAISSVETGAVKPWPNFRKAIAAALRLPESEIFDDEYEELEVKKR